MIPADDATRPATSASLELQVVVERLVEVRTELQVEEGAEGAQQHRHRQSEGEGHTDPDRQSAHPACSSRSRYPLPRTVSIEFVPNGLSIFLRNRRT